MSMTIVKLPNGLLVASLSDSETTFIYDELFERVNAHRSKARGIQISLHVLLNYEEAYRNTYGLEDLVHLQSGDVVLDIGANVGMVKERYPGVTVHCFEPVPTTYSALVKTLAIYSHNSLIRNPSRTQSIITTTISNENNINTQTEIGENGLLPNNLLSKSSYVAKDNVNASNRNETRAHLALREEYVSKEETLTSIKPHLPEGLPATILSGYKGLLNTSTGIIDNNKAVYDCQEKQIWDRKCFPMENIHVYNYGLSNVDGEIDVKYYPYMPGNSTIHSESKEGQRAITTASFFDDATICRCQFRSLGTVISELKLRSIALLKVDTEGHEFHVLKGLRMGDWLKIRQIAIEVHGDVTQSDRMKTLLIGRGFKIKSQPDRITGNIMIWGYR